MSLFDKVSPENYATKSYKISDVLGQILLIQAYDEKEVHFDPDGNGSSSKSVMYGNAYCIDSEGRALEKPISFSSDAMRQFARDAYEDQIATGKPTWFKFVMNGRAYAVEDLSPAEKRGIMDVVTGIAPVQQPLPLNDGKSKKSGKPEPTRVKLDYDELGNDVVSDGDIPF